MNEKTTEIETKIAQYFGIRRNLIIPNVSWGLSLHECDVLILTPSDFLYEIEIKTSKSDLRADKRKRHGHCSNKIRMLYFAITEELIEHIDLIPERAGVLVCGLGDPRRTLSNLASLTKSGRERFSGVHKYRSGAINQDAKKITVDERHVLARLGAMRVWRLKEELISIHTSFRNLQKGGTDGLVI